MKAMFNTRNKWIVVLCLFAELQCGVFKASNTGPKTLKITGKKHHDRTKETMKEKRFTMTAVPKGRVVYAYVTDRNRYVRPRRPRLYRAYIVRRPLIFRPRTTVNTVERQNIPYVEMQPTYPREELPRAPIITSQPWYYYQEQPAVLGQGLAGFSEPFPEEETFPEVPQEYSVHIDRCQPNPCYNGGRCRSHRNGRFKCLCRRGFNGRLCQVMRTKCKPNPCFNGGTCTDVNEGFECSCTFGYKGETCEQKAMCRGSPCLNGGSCTELDSEYQCSCLPGYRGRKCQEISYCYKSPCRNGGTCMETESGFECICTAEWSCKDCGCTTAIKHSDTRDDCFQNSCLNGGTCLVTYHGFKCLCLQGYKGDICEAPEYCTSAPCLNGGTCKETNSGYNCLCKSRFRGPNCEVENHCRPKNPCSNGGLCVEEDDGYKCRCKIGYTGVNCEEKEPCVPNPCKNGGTCIAEQDGYSCMCQANFRGEICQIQEMCASNPCLHKGTCIDMDNNSFKCLCAAGWMGHNCEEKDSCIPNPCNNGGNCHRHGFTFECKCALGYKGKHCEAKDPCSPNPCHNRGHCLARGENGFKCKCGHEFTGFKCEKVNPCYPDPCTNGGTCKTIAESFNCACPLGRLGEFCEVSDPCFPNPCQNDGSCSALSHGGYHCTCVHAFVGALCAVPDPCMPSPCLNNGTCVNTGTTFHCRCAPGFSGSRCEHHSKCVPNPCLHDGTCRDVDLARGYVCYCSVAYLGPNCERTNLCYPHNPCQNGGTCKSDGTNQACHCVPGYLGSQCEQFNYCHSSPCKNDGTCTPKTNGFECECKQGFFGKKCETLSSHCFPNPCKNEGLCTEIKNKDGYMCICREGFVGDNCERNDPCAPNPCQNSGTCLEAHTKRGYHCLCTPGWRGYVCDRQDLCSPKSPCLHGGTCFNALDTFICHCPPRYTGNNCTTDKCDRCDEQANCLKGTCECKHGFVGNGFTCIPAGNPCQPNPCENGGTCNRGHGGKLFECVCKEGFTGNKCEVSKSACVSSPCVNGGTCVDATNNDGSVLEGVVFTNHSQYKCVCAKGYAGQNCQKLVLVNPCSTHPCVNNGTCFDDANSAEMNIKLLNSLDFRCFCPIGFSGIICQIPYSACKSSPCLHGGSCLDSSNTADVAFSANGYKCLCVEGFNGPNCEDVSESSSRPLAIPVLPQVTPQLPNAARTSAMAQKGEPSQLIKPVALTISPNIGATAELTKPSQSQIEVAVIPKVPERASVATNAGVPSSSGPPIVTFLAPPNYIGNIPEAQNQSPSRPVGYLVPPSAVLKYVPSLNLQTASAKAVSPNIVSRIKSASSPSSSAALIPSPAFQSSDESDTAAFPVVVQSPIIAMPPGMKPPPDENRLLNPASIKGAPRLLLPTLQENSHQRGITYQASNAGYYSHEPGDRNQPRQGYRKSPYSNIQGHFGYLYPENGYQTNVKAKGTLHRRYRHIEDTSHQSYSRRRSLMTSRN